MTAVLARALGDEPAARKAVVRELRAGAECEINREYEDEAWDEHARGEHSVRAAAVPEIEGEQPDEGVERQSRRRTHGTKKRSEFGLRNIVDERNQTEEQGRS